jgi:hypothetical protein
MLLNDCAHALLPVRGMPNVMHAVERGGCVCRAPYTKAEAF